nr:TPA_asm: hypothetical protein HUJ06_013724 [Nelumbo nucifera]
MAQVARCQHMGMCTAMESSYWRCSQEKDQQMKCSKLHRFAKMAFPEEVMKILDPKLLPMNGVGEETEEETRLNFGSLGNVMDKLQEFIAPVIRIGIQCSAESPKERMDINDVARELNQIREAFLGIVIEAHQVRPTIQSY